MRVSASVCVLLCVCYRCGCLAVEILVLNCDRNRTWDFPWNGRVGVTVRFLITIVFSPWKSTLCNIFVVGLGFI